MGFFRAATFLPLLLLLHFHNLVSADESLIQRECRKTKVPHLCIRCLNSDPSSEHADSKAMASILINCLSSQADSLASTMTELGSSERDQTVRNSSKECVKDYKCAKKELRSAKVALMNNDIDGSLRSLIAAMKSDIACHEAIMVDIMKMPKGIFYKMTVYDELSEAVNQIIGMLRN